MQAAWVASMFAQPPIVLGRRLRHFSAWHALALEVMESPFLAAGTGTSDSPVSTHDLILAAYICGTEWPAGAEKLGDGSATNEAKEWGLSLQGSCDFGTELSVFMRYLGDYLQFPRMWWGKDARKSGMPVAYKLVASMVVRGMAEQAAWNMSMSRLGCYMVCLAEQEGAHLVSEKTEEILQRIRDAGLEWKAPESGL